MASTPSTTSQNHRRRDSARRLAISTAADNWTASTIPSPKADDWDCNYKLENGRLISTNIYSGTVITPPTSPSRRKSIGFPPTTPSVVDNTRRPVGLPQWTPTKLYDPQDEVTKWHDPDPIRQIVDAKDDDEFLGAIHPTEPHTSNAVDEHTSHPVDHNELRLKFWREQNAEAEPDSLSPSPKPRRRRETRELATIEQVLREMYPRGKSGQDGSSAAASVIAESEMRKEMSMDSRIDMDDVKICSSDGGLVLEFPRQTVTLSGWFVKLMDREGFDGELVLAETKAAVEMLGAWMSRDLDFEITQGIARSMDLISDNYRELLRMADLYEIPRLEKDVIVLSPTSLISAAFV
jgi:hypothetical protein